MLKSPSIILRNDILNICIKFIWLKHIYYNTIGPSLHYLKRTVIWRLLFIS